MDEDKTMNQDAGAPVSPAPAPAPAPSAPAMEEAAAKGGAMGSILGLILIVAVLVVGAFYVWGQRLETAQPAAQEDVQQGTMPTGSMEASVELDGEGPQPQ